MAQRPFLRPRIAERNVPELDLVFPVGALLGRESALVHLVRRVEKIEEGAQERRVAPHIPGAAEKLREMAGKTRERGDILRDAPRAERPGERLEAHKKIRRRGEQHREHGARDHERAAAPPRELRKRAVYAERRLPGGIVLADLLLVIHPDVGGAVALADRHCRKEVEIPVAEPRLRREL